MSSRPHIERIFLDYASSTPIDESVMEKMKLYRERHFANPSALYAEALAAKEEMQIARGDVARLLGARDSEIVFTSGGTESNNLALLGVFEYFKQPDFVPHIVTTTIEHPAILEVCSEIERRGGRVTYVPVSEDGLVNPSDVVAALTRETVLVSVMSANNEIGTIQPIREIVRGVLDFRQTHHTAFPYIHTDACQSVLYTQIDVRSLGVDMFTVDGLKIYGPRSSGLLYIKDGTKLQPILFGGGQEKGLRSGTEDIEKIVGLSTALEIADIERERESERLRQIRDYGIDAILQTFPGAVLNGSQEKRLPNNINICFPGLDAEFAVISLDVFGIAVSYSSSCRTLKEDSSSYVLSALGKESCRNSSVRITMGRGTKKEHIDAFISALKKVMQ